MASRARLATVFAAAVAAALAVAVAVRADAIRSGQYYGAYVAPAQGGHSAYSDGCSFWWVGNRAVWPGADAARVTFIDVAGGWHYTLRSTTSPVTREITLQESKAIGRSKLRCENASDFAVYYVACSFLSEGFANCV